MTSSSMFEQDPIWSVLLQLLVTLLVLFIVIRLIYYRYSRNERRVFSFFQMGIMIFLVCILLKTVEIQLGIALGLFAIFAILRFRSRNLSMRDMTYFFTVIGISVINAMATFYNPVRGIIVINSVIILSTFILEIFFNKRAYDTATLIYDRLELLAPEKIQELLSDISSRSCKKVEKVEIKKIDLIKRNAELEISFRSTDAGK
jgi:magnesium-transporting ATPase (P-type)